MKRHIVSAILAIAAIMGAGAEPVFYQGTLTDIYGDPSKGETVTLRLALLDAEGRVLYAENHTATSGTDGSLFTQIGTGTATDGEFTDEVWAATASLGVTIERADGSEITDVASLGYTPAAIHAAEAEALVSPAAADGSRYILAVDDGGNLSTARQEFDVIPVPDGYTRLVFHDEFDGTGLPDPEKWGYEEGYVRNGELQYYTRERVENCEQADGVLHLRCLNDNVYPDPVNGGVCKYTSASIHTQDKFKFTYGRVDVRSKLSDVKGTWPAIWMMPNDSYYGPWPRSGEIDIMEQVAFDPVNVHFTCHTYLENGDGNKHHYSMRVPTCYTDFHVYSLEWTENKLTWLVDGKRGFTVVKNSPLWTGWPFDRDFYLMLGLAWGGGWGGQQGIDAESLPAEHQVDYVRVFQ